MPFTDASIVGSKADSVIIVYEMGRTARAALLRTKTQLESVGANVLGVALNHIKPETYAAAGYYQYYYRYKYRYGEKGKGEEESQEQETT